MNNSISISKIPTIKIENTDDGKSSYELAKEYLASNMNYFLYYNNYFYKRSFKEQKYIKFQNENDLKTDILKFLYESGYYDFMINKKVSNVVTALKGICLIENKEQVPFFITKNVKSRYIPLKNGLLNIDSAMNNEDNLLFKHDPDYFSTSCLEFEYNPKSECPTFQDILNFALPNKETKRVLQQWFGYNLINRTDLEKMMIFLGKGRNGKSLLLFILRTLLGEDNISTVPLESFGKRFQTYQTIGKKANIVGEVSDKARFPETSIKSFISGEPFTADVKFKDPVIVYPTARITVAANNFPNFKDTTDGIWRRIILIDFKNQVNLKDVRPEYMTKEFWFETGEIQGVFNWALEGLIDLQKNDICIPKESKELLSEIRSSLNPIESFLIDHLVEDETSTVLTKDIFMKYEKYCTLHGYYTSSAAVLGKEIKKVFPSAKSIAARTIPGTEIRSRVWRGIRLKNKEELKDN